MVGKRQRRRITRIILANRLHGENHVRDGPSHRSDRLEVEKNRWESIAARNTAARWFESDKTGVGCWAADRSAAVGSNRDRTEPGANCGDSAAAGAAGGQRQTPRVARRSKQQIVGVALQRKFRTVGLPEHYRAAGTQPGDR